MATDELIIVGSRYGDLGDILKPLFAEGATIAGDDVKRKIGCELVYMMKRYNHHDLYAIGVFSTTTKKHIGYLWTYQAYSMYEWMTENNVESVRARISLVDSKYGFMIAKPVNKMKLEIRPRESLYVDKEWAVAVPQVMPCRKGEWLNLSMEVLEDGLAESDSWNEGLKVQIDNVINDLAYVLSDLGDTKGIKLYLRMKESKIQEVREESRRLLHAMIHRGSLKRMKWWMENCLTRFLHDASESPLLKMFESANFTLERVEALLHQAPENLFHVYQADREKFATHLYYSALPHEVYRRFMTLLAVWILMTEQKTDNVDDDGRIARTIETLRQEGELKHLYDFTWIMETMNQTEGLPKFNTPRSFINYMKTLGINNLPSEDSINRKQNTFIGTFPNWEFTDCDTTEGTRRINIGKRFLSIFRSM